MKKVLAVTSLVCAFAAQAVSLPSANPVLGDGGSFASTYSISLTSGSWLVTLDFDNLERGAGNKDKINYMSVSFDTLVSPAVVATSGPSSVSFAQSATDKSLFTGTLTGSPAGSTYSLTFSGSVGNSGWRTLKYDAAYTAVASPVPEPETYALMLAGLGVVGWAVRRRRGESALQS